jgi:hypothetical protein
VPIRSTTPLIVLIEGSMGNAVFHGTMFLTQAALMALPVPKGAGTSGRFALGEVDKVTLARLKLGADIEIPAGTTGIRTMMSDLTLVSGNEVALLRTVGGRRILRMGGPKSVPLDKYVDRVIAHTHPSGRLNFSQADIKALNKLEQRSSVIIDPRANMGARLPVPPLP